MATNDYGLDVDYTKKKLEELVRDVASYSPDEMRRALARLAETCNPESTCPACGSKNTQVFGADHNQCKDCNKIYSVC